MTGHVLFEATAFELHVLFHKRNVTSVELAPSSCFVNFVACARSIFGAQSSTTTSSPTQGEKLICFDFAVDTFAAVRSPAASLRVFKCAVAGSRHSRRIRLSRSCGLSCSISADDRFFGCGSCVQINRPPLANVPCFFLARCIVPLPAFLMKHSTILPLFKVVWLTRSPRSEEDGSSINECLEIEGVAVSLQSNPSRI